jgi:hypothetical protein
MSAHFILLKVLNLIGFSFGFIYFSYLWRTQGINTPKLLFIV